MLASEEWVCWPAVYRFDDDRTGCMTDDAKLVGRDDESVERDESHLLHTVDTSRGLFEERVGGTSIYWLVEGSIVYSLAGVTWLYTLPGGA